MSASLKETLNNSTNLRFETRLLEDKKPMGDHLRARGIRNPDIDRAGVLQMFRRMAHDLLTQN